MRDLIIATVRTASQALTTFAIAGLLSIGIVVDAVSVENLFTAVAMGLVTLILNLLSSKAPWINRVLSLGLSTSDPTYDE